MTNQEDKIKDFWKITEMQKALDLEIKSEFITQHTQSEECYLKTKIKLMQEAQEFGFQQGISSERERCLKIIDEWKIDINDEDFKRKETPFLKISNYFYPKLFEETFNNNLNELKSKINSEEKTG